MEKHEREERLRRASEMEQLREELSRASRENADLKRDFTTLEVELETVKTQKHTAEEDKARLETRFNSLETEKNTLEREKAQLTTEFDSLMAEKISAVNEGDRLASEMEQLREEQARASRENEDLKREFTTLEVELETVKTQKHTAEEDKAELETRFNSLETEKNTLEREKAQLNTEFDSLMAEKINAVNEGDRLARQVLSLQNQLTESQEKIQKLKIEIQPYQSLGCCTAMTLIYFLMGFSYAAFFARRFNNMGTGAKILGNAAYYVVITAFTIGFGDIAPNHWSSKLVTCLLVVLGVHVVNCLIVLQGHIWTKVKIKYITNVEPKRTRTIHGLAALAVFVSIIVGMSGIIAYENGENVNLIEDYRVTILDAFYLSTMSLSTEGFGDKSFKTISGRVFAIIWLLIFQPLYSTSMKFLMDSAVKNLIDHWCPVTPV